MIALLLAMAGSDPCPGLPLTVGSTWRYRAEVAWAVAGDSAASESLAWTTTVLAVQTSDSAVAAAIQGWPDDLAWWQPGRAPTVSILYCMRGRVYHIRRITGTPATAMAALLSSEQRPALDDLVLELPLRTGKLFGRDAAARRDTFYAWFVEAADPVPPAVRRLRPGLGDSLYSVVYQTNPDYTLLGFVPGLGLAHYVYRHHGTTAEVDAWLVGYHAGEP